MKRALKTIDPNVTSVSRLRKESIFETHFIKEDIISSPSKLKPDSNQDLEKLNHIINLPYPNDQPKEDRLFGLKEVPVYRPTPQEFLDPQLYIQNIRLEAEKYGLCKIIPPDGWKPKFTMDIKSFQFKTRVQQLNLIGAKTRTKLNYIEQLNAFHSQANSNKRFCNPILRKRVDLFLLKDEVISRGDPNIFTPKDWENIGKALGFVGSDCKRNALSLKEIYFNFIVPFELYLKESDPDSPISEQRTGAFCENCADSRPTDEFIRCISCKRGYHVGCLKSLFDLKAAPDWLCAPCLKSQVQDFGFSIGKAYTLCSFMKKADKFKAKKFTKETLSKSGNELENSVEKEFWRLINSPLEPVSVEYGADLHCPDNGSAFPTSKTDPKDPMSQHPWNLSVLPNLPDSLFSLLNKKISGITVPWVYTGMCFSTFCWHNEDHYTYSVNYHHWGDTKTWYSIPGSQASKFENAIKAEVPELFEKHPDLLFHLSTLISPESILKHDVPVYAADQRPGQFIITFPQAYHAGFNHGFNFNEAVNFASLDWFPYGLASVKNYQNFFRLPVFSHHQLLITALSEKIDSKSASLLLGPTLEMKNSESKDRENVLGIIGSSQVIHNLSITPQCITCSVYCYLSTIVCQCKVSKDKYACFLHYSDLCNCPPSNKILRIHIEKHVLESFVDKLLNISDVSHPPM